MNMNNKNKFFISTICVFIVMLCLIGFFIYKSTYNVPNDDRLLKEHINNFLNKNVADPYESIDIKDIVNIDNLKFVLIQKDRNTLGKAIFKKGISGQYRIMSVSFSNERYDNVVVPTSKKDVIFFYGVNDAKYPVHHANLSFSHDDNVYSIKIPDKKYFVSYLIKDKTSGHTTSYSSENITFFDKHNDDITKFMDKPYEDSSSNLFFYNSTHLENYIKEAYFNDSKDNNKNKFFSEFLLVDRSIYEDKTVYYLQGMTHEISNENNIVKLNSSKDIFIKVTYDKINSNILEFKSTLDFKDSKEFFKDIPSDILPKLNTLTLINERKEHLNKLLKSRSDLYLKYLKNK